MKKKIISIITIAICVILITLDIFLLFGNLIGIKDLSYPLTAILPTLTLLFGLAFLILIILSILKWENNKSCKKHFIISITLFILSIIFYACSSPINSIIQDNDIGLRNLGDKEYSINGVKYNVPKSWRYNQINENNYHYPFTSNKKIMFYVSSQKLEDISTKTLCILEKELDSYNKCYEELNDEYNSFLNGIEKGFDYFKLVSEKNTTILNYRGKIVKYKIKIDDSFFSIEHYMFLDIDTNILYNFQFAINESVSKKEIKQKNITKLIPKIIKSIKER